jgi:hypothetical protein
MAYRAINSPKADAQVKSWGLPDYFRPFVQQEVDKFLEDPSKDSRDPPCPPFVPIGRIYEFSVSEDPFCYYFRLHFFYGPGTDEITITAAVMQPAYQSPPPGATPGVSVP